LVPFGYFENGTVELEKRQEDSGADMTIEINPDQERFDIVGDLLDQALETLAPHEAPEADAQETRRRRARSAAARIRALRKGLSLGGLYSANFKIIPVSVATHSEPSAAARNMARTAVAR
jgi:hypothetical protein